MPHQNKTLTIAMPDHRDEAEGMKSYLRIMVTFLTALGFTLLALFAKPLFTVALVFTLTIGWSLAVTGSLRLYDKEGTESRVAVMGIAIVPSLLMMCFGHVFVSPDQAALVAVSGFCTTMWGAFFRRRR